MLVEFHLPWSNVLRTLGIWVPIITEDVQNIDVTAHDRLHDNTVKVAPFAFHMIHMDGPTKLNLRATGDIKILRQFKICPQAHSSRLV